MGMAGSNDRALGGLHGVIAAIATAVDADGEPNCAKSIALARFLLSNGCDGLNVLGTTGEATSFALEQRQTARRIGAHDPPPPTL